MHQIFTKEYDKPSTLQCSINSAWFLCLCYLCCTLLTHNYGCHESYVYKLHRKCSINKHMEAETKWSSFCKRYFQTYFLHESHLSSIEKSMKYVPKDPINNNPAWLKILFSILLGLEESTNASLKWVWNNRSTLLDLKTDAFESLH